MLGTGSGQGIFGEIASVYNVGSSASSFPLYDAQGNAGNFTDSSETISSTLTYDTFGNIVNQSGTTNPTVSWAGKQGYYFDSILNLFYVRERWYDPVTRQFISQDPLGFGGGDTNLFRYAVNNPVNKDDPSGTDIINDVPTSSIFLTNTVLPHSTSPAPTMPISSPTAGKSLPNINRTGLDIVGRTNTSAMVGNNLYFTLPSANQMPSLPSSIDMGALTPFSIHDPTAITVQNAPPSAIAPPTDSFLATSEPADNTPAGILYGEIQKEFPGVTWNTFKEIQSMINKRYGVSGNRPDLAITTLQDVEIFGVQNFSGMTAQQIVADYDKYLTQPQYYMEQEIAKAVQKALNQIEKGNASNAKISPYTAEFAQIGNPSAIDLSKFHRSFTSHGTAVEAQIPGSNYALKLYKDPQLGYVAAVVDPTSTYAHYFDTLLYESDIQINLYIAINYLKH